MDAGIRGFGQSAIGLARNPLGIIALFIVLVYGFASLVTGASGAFTPGERMPLIYFLVFFPPLVLAAFTWLVSRHSGKLFAPTDFRNEENYLKAQVSAAASLAASLTVASTKTQQASSEVSVQQIVDIVEEAVPSTSADIEARRHGNGWRNHILWVDDRPQNNVHERRAFEAFGLRFTVTQSTTEALEHLARQRFGAVISDMDRREGPREGYVLLDKLRSQGNKVPLFFYSSSNAPEHKQETAEHGGQGCTNNAQELFQMVTRAIIGNK